MSLLLPSNIATIPPSRAITIVEGKIIATVTPPAIRINFNNDFPTNFNFFLFVFPFIFSNSDVNSSFNPISSSSVKFTICSIVYRGGGRGGKGGGGGKGVGGGKGGGGGRGVGEGGGRGGG